MLNYGYLVAITIIDEANNNDIVVYNVYNILPSGSYSTTFSSTQAGIEDYCSQQHDSPPSFKIFVDVQMRDPSGNQFCGQKSTNSSYTCSIISSGLELPTLTIY
ncbi:MAG: hypothetical protein A2W85_03275 [Bacteroidetes bacterium GWF2_41_31]|nr:MAG: hypothetical protein A2W85_03275 [Bacteroidetes bacterium GWF2_41_31]